MALNATSIAPAVGASVRNVQFQSEALNLPRKILVLATYDPAKTAVTPLAPVQVLSAEDAGDRFGFGFMAHRLAVQAFRGGQGVPVYVIPIEEASGAAASAGNIDFTGSTGVAAGTLYLYVAGLSVPVAIAASATAGEIATAVVAAIGADNTLPVTAEVNGTTAGQVDFTAKSKGPWGDDITLAFNRGYGQSLPSGVAAAVTAMSGGSGIPDVGEALDALGTGDDANEDWYTDVCHGFGQDTTTLDAISTYVGAGNDFLGLYSKTVSRPFRALTGDTAAGSSGLADLVSLAGGRLLDRANGVFPAPGSYSHPAEIATQALAHLARINQDRAAQSGSGIPLIGIDPGDKADRWTSDYDNRDTAIKSGICTSRVRNGVLTIDGMVSFYRPANVPVSSNGYRSMRNISIIQNMLYNIRLNFEQEKWQGVSIVADTQRVTNTTDRQKARDVDSVIDDLMALTVSFESHAWIYEAAFTIGRLKQAGMVTVRAGGLGFDSILPVIFSGEGGILDTTVEFDTSLAVLFN